MNDSSFVRLAGACAILALPVAWASFLLGPAAYGWDFDLLFDPARSIAVADVPLGLVRMGWVLDVFGYYFLLLPAVLVLSAQTRAGAPLATAFASRMSLAYMLVGSTGAGMLAGTTALFQRYAAGDDTARAAITEVYSAIFTMVADGVWNIVAMACLAAWLLVGGSVLRPSRPKLGVSMILLGVCAAVDVVGLLAGAVGLSHAALYVYLTFFPVWAASVGISLVRAPATSH